MNLNLQDEIRHIIEGCKTGDRGSQFKLYKLLASKLLFIGMRYTKNKQEAEDCLQEAFIKIFVNISNYKNESSITTWATRIMINTTITKMKKNININNQLEIEEARNVHSNSNESTPEHQEILLILNQLPDIYRLVFNMYEIEGYSHKEIGEAFSITESSSRSYLFRAKEMLKKSHANLNYIHNEKSLS